jgi:hypothetical protein
VNAQSSPHESALRSFDELFPGFVDSRRNEVFSHAGFVNSLKKNEPPTITPAAGSGIALLEHIMKIEPTFIAESLLIIPYQEKHYDKLDAYNALGKVRDLKGRLYHSHTRDAEVPLFEDATRIESAQRNNPIPDPSPSSVLPQSETVFLRLKDINFGNSYYRGDFSQGRYGITYALTNIRSLSYLFFPVMREGKFIAILYMEPLAEGMLVYSMAGADASDFVASRVDIPSAISKRLAVFIAWISDGLQAGS